MRQRSGAESPTIQVRKPLVRDEYLTENGLFHYRASGLDNVFLDGGYKISKSGKSYSICNQPGLHDVICTMLVETKSTLTGKELRFLRKEIGLSQSKLAARVGVDVQTVARWEKEAKGHNMADRMVRVLYLTNRFSKEMPTNVASLLDSISELDDTEHQEWIFEQGINRGEWLKRG